MKVQFLAGQAACLVMCMTGSLQVLGQFTQTESFQASGCCPWCGENVESALDVKGVKYAVWDQYEQRVTVKYRPRKTSLKELQRLVAAKGHDTDAFLAPDSAYLALPGCCHYRD
jgi:hypothetical protein